MSFRPQFQGSWNNASSYLFFNCTVPIPPRQEFKIVVMSPNGLAIPVRGIQKTALFAVSVYSASLDAQAVGYISTFAPVGGECVHDKRLLVTTV